MPLKTPQRFKKRLQRFEAAPSTIPELISHIKVDVKEIEKNYDELKESKFRVTLRMRFTETEITFQWIPFTGSSRSRIHPKTFRLCVLFSIVTD